MRMLHPNAGHDLTYSDVFMVPNRSEVTSRFDVDLTTPDRVGTTIPLVVANMTAVAGRRMAEVVARRGGIAVLPQDIPVDVIGDRGRMGQEPPSDVRDRRSRWRRPTRSATRSNLIHKRAHGAVIVIDDELHPIGVFTEHDAVGFDRFTQLQHVMSTELDTLPADVTAEQAFRTAPRGAPHAGARGRSRRTPARADDQHRGAAFDDLSPGGRSRRAVAAGGRGRDQRRPGRARRGAAGAGRRRARDRHRPRPPAEDDRRDRRRAGCVSRHASIVAGNVVTASGTRDLIEAGADIVKVGVGPGAMCTTRMMTGVGRPQFSAVVECSDEAARLGKHVWADGGVRFPRDVALALAGGAASVMVGSWLAGTHESAADTLRDTDGRLYKESFGMASNRAVRSRTRTETSIDRARKELFEEGISTSRMYLDPQRPGVEDIIDQIVAGVRSACTYAGAATIEQFHDRAVVGVQSHAGYDEGRPLGTSW